MIKIRSLEFSLCHHCNLSCKGCSHMSPIQREEFIDIDETIKSLKILNKYAFFENIRLLGGEPTLNPNLLEIIKKIREVNIITHITLVTNGLLLNKLNDEILKNINRIEISMYNYSQTKQQTIYDWCKEITKKYNISIYVTKYAHFREPFCYVENKDNELVEKIYNNCLSAKIWMCYNIYNNYLFKCPQALALSKLNNDISKNAIRIEDNCDFEKKLEDYVNSNKPLEACKNCLSSFGKKFNIEQIEKSKFKSNASAEELIDLDLLNNYIQDKNDINLQLTEAFSYIIGGNIIEQKKI